MNAELTDKVVLGADLDTEQLRKLAGRVPVATLERLHQVEILRWRKFEALSHGFVTLVDVMGDDASIVQAARVSYGAGTKHVSEDRTLISYLARNRHTTPFEMAEIKLLIKCPMDLWRQWIRHRTANVNEYSTRYSVAIDDADQTPPDKWRVQSQKNKQGSGQYLGAEWPEGYYLDAAGEDLADRLLSNRIPTERKILEQDHKHWFLIKKDPEHPEGEEIIYGFQNIAYADITPGLYLSQLENDLHEQSREVYEERVEDFDIAREQARKDLPLSTYTMAYWKCDLHNIFHFLGLRMDSHAQWEIRQFANIIGEQIVAPLFPAAWDAFTRYRLNSTFVSGPCKEVLKRMQSQFGGSDSHITLGAYSQDAFEMAVSGVYPQWMKRDDEGKLKNHREREEVRSTLRGLGLLQAGEV